MADITSMFLAVKTSGVDNAGTDGDVFLGVGGREFHCDREGENFDTNYLDRFWFGYNSNVIEPEYNDPRVPKLTVEDAYRFPMYIRFSQSGDSSEWCLEYATLFINLNQPGPRPIFTCNPVNLWLGNSKGDYCYMIERDSNTPHHDDAQLLSDQ